MTLVFLSTGCLHRHRRPATASHGAPPAAPSRRAGSGPTPAPRAAPIVQGEEGIASWYGRPYHGRRTASGEIYNMYAISAAHRTLPFGTRALVHNLENGRSVEVYINDRGPFVEGRIIDLSYAAAQSIHMPGTALVRLEILGFGLQGSLSLPPGFYAVQVGAFKEPENALRLKDLISPHFGPVIIQPYDRGDALLHRVRVGHETSEEAARALARELREANLATDTFVVRLD